LEELVLEAPKALEVAIMEEEMLVTQVLLELEEEQLILPT
jgi:hypothetical protein